MLEQYVIVKAIHSLTAEPNRAFSVRGFASHTGISPGASRIALEFMQKNGIAKLAVVGNSHQYKADLESALCRQWKILFNLNQLAESNLVGQLIEKIPGLQSLLLYGSFGNGTNDKKSDIDILAIAHNPSKSNPSIRGIKKEVNLIVFSPAEWKKKALQDRVFYENIIYDSIVLYGERPVVV